MREPLVCEEIWGYICRHCLRVWDEEFESRTVDDGHGGVAVTYWQNGRRATPPLTGRLCPNCASTDVKVLPNPAPVLARVAAPPSVHASYDELLGAVFRLRRMHAY